MIDINNANIELIINNELNRLKEEEKTLKNALFLKTQRYMFNNLASTNLKNNVEIINHNKEVDQTPPAAVEQVPKQTQNSNNSRLESILDGLKYFENADASMHQCHLCSSQIHNNEPTVNTSNEFLDTYLKATQSTTRKRVSPTIQDLNKQQTLYYDHKKYVKPANHVTFKEHTNNNSGNSIVSEYRKDLIRPKTAIVRGSHSNLSRNGKNIIQSISPLLRSSSTFFNYEDKRDKEDQSKNLKKKYPPWHYTSATVYPWRDHSLTNKK